MAALRATRLYSQCCSCLSNSITNSAARSRILQRGLCSSDQMTDSNRNAQASEKEPETRKEFRRYRSRISKQNRSNPDLERKSRLGNLIIDLDEVNKVWMAREGLKHIHKLAKHYGIYEHVFGGAEFIPSKLLDVRYGGDDGVRVHWGNFITPSQSLSSPSVSFESNNDLWSLILINPDGNIWYEDAELLHWFVANIPGNDISQGQEVIGYLPPVPAKGTGYHRFIFCLLQQKTSLDVQQLTPSDPSFSSQRSFKLTDLLSRHQEVLVPTGLSFFQANWDETVTKIYSDTIGIPEPVYDTKSFVTPTNQRKHTTRDTFDHKYRNM